MRAINYIAETYSEASFFWRNMSRAQRWILRAMLTAVAYCLITYGVPPNA